MEQRRGRGRCREGLGAASLNCMYSFWEEFLGGGENSFWEEFLEEGGGIRSPPLVRV